MQETNNNKFSGILRTGAFTIAAVLVLVTVIAGVGSIIGWRTTTQFSNGFFIVGAVAAVFGAYSALSGFGMRANPGVSVARTASPASLEERNRQTLKDKIATDNFAIAMTIVGLLLIGVAVLIPNLFG